MISVHLNKQNAFQGRLYAFELFYTMFMSLEKKTLILTKSAFV